MRKDLDISAYLVVGPENTMGRPVSDADRKHRRCLYGQCPEIQDSIRFREIAQQRISVCCQHAGEGYQFFP